MLRKLGDVMKSRGVNVLVVEATAGDNFGYQTMSYLSRSKGMIALAYGTYGQLTQSPYCSFYEVEHAHEHGKPIIPVKMYKGDWPPTPADFDGGTKGKVQNEFVFKKGAAYLDFAKFANAKSTDKAAVEEIATQIIKAWEKACSSSCA